MIPEIATAIVTEMPKAIGIKPRAVAAIDMPNTLPIRKQIGPFIDLIPTLLDLISTFSTIFDGFVFGIPYGIFYLFISICLLSKGRIPWISPGNFLLIVLLDSADY